MTTFGLVSRRTAIGGALGLGVMSSGPAHAAERGTPSSIAATRQWTSTFLNLDPQTNFKQAMRLQRSLIDDDEILHWYHFIMFAVTPGRAPGPVVRWEGIELSRHRFLNPMLMRVHGHNLSFPRDLDSGAFVDSAINPLTGKRVKVDIMALTGDPGMFLSSAGVVSLDDKTQTFRPKYAQIRREGDRVKIDGIRVPPATWPVTFLEVGYEAAPAALFDDPRQLWLPAEVSGAYVFPFPDWMEMGDSAGHMFAAWSGHKLRTASQLPPEFLAKARAIRPDLLTVDPAAFDRAVPLPQG